MKQAVLAVSFGTSHDETREKTIGAVEEEFRAVCRNIPVIRVFSSGIIVRNLRKREIMVPTLEEAFERLYEHGYEEIIVQPTVVIPGEEYEKLYREAKVQEKRFAKVKVGEPLLMRETDMKRLVREFCRLFPEEEKTALVLMGHGSGNPANSIYKELREMFLTNGRPSVYVGTIKTDPSLTALLPLLQEGGYRRVVLSPLMLVAGEHAVNEMAGASPESWKGILEERGFKTETVIRGLGEYEGIRKMYAEKLEKLM